MIVGMETTCKGGPCARPGFTGLQSGGDKPLPYRTGAGNALVSLSAL